MGVYQTCERYLMRWSSPERLYRVASKLQAISLILMIGFFGYGLVWGLYIVPPDYQQGDAFRIIYVHVPSAFLSLFIYTFAAGMGFVGLVWRVKTSFMLMKSALPIGMVFTALALITGSIWAKPMWGTWWVWDARLTSELVLLFMYFGLYALHNAISNEKRADTAVAVLAIIGVVNIPIIHYSVYWWFTLHQGATVAVLGKPAIDAVMRYPLYAMILGSFAFFFMVLAKRVQTEILERLHQTSWVKEEICKHD